MFYRKTDAPKLYELKSFGGTIMINRIVIGGRLTHDPELRHTQSDIPVCSFSIACDRDYSRDDQRETDFIDVVAWRSTAEFVSKYFKKGRMAIVDGRLQIRDWTDREGKKRRSAEVIADNVYFGDSKPKQEDAGDAPGPDGLDALSGFDPGFDDPARSSFAELPDGFDPGFGV